MLPQIRSTIHFQLRGHSYQKFGDNPAESNRLNVKKAGKAHAEWVVIDDPHRVYIDESDSTCDLIDPEIGQRRSPSAWAVSPRLRCIQHRIHHGEKIAEVFGNCLPDERVVSAWACYLSPEQRPMQSWCNWNLRWRHPSCSAILASVFAFPRPGWNAKARMESRFTAATGINTESASTAAFLPTKDNIDGCGSVESSWHYSGSLCRLSSGNWQKFLLSKYKILSLIMPRIFFFLKKAILLNSFRFWKCNILLERR